jgi:adenine-specific DNA-methyltransferase
MPTLTWLTRDNDTRVASKVPYRLLEEAPELGHGDRDSGNMLIQGDNLDALKALLPFYAGRVKCIYIDPPYNTKSAFEHYNDNLEHSQWLAMIYPRLELLRDFLSDDGSIWVSIDDNEGHYLKVIMDEIFGRGNFYTSFIWQKVDSPNDNTSPVNPDHEFIMCFTLAPTKKIFNPKEDDSILAAYPGILEDGTRYRDRLLRKNGKASLRTDRESMWFPIDDPDGEPVYPIRDDLREGRWAFGVDGVKELKKDGRLIWKRRPSKEGGEVWVPYSREFAPKTPSRPHQTILLDVKTSRQAKAHVRATLPDAEIFETVKPEQLVQRILKIATNPGDLVLDSFLGSGTTAAVAHKMGRQYIGIEMGDHAVTHCAPRLRKVIDGEQGGVSEVVGWEGGGGFRFYRLGPPVFDADGHIRRDISFPVLASHVWFSETGAPWNRRDGTPVLGIHQGTAYALLYNGVLGDKRPQGGNVLTTAVLRGIRADIATLDPSFDGPLVIYGESARLGEARLKALGVTFKQTPYDVKAR